MTGAAISHNTYIHRIVRPAVRTLVNTPITPNQVTITRLAGGLAAAGCFAVGATGWGSPLFVIALLLDRADGELARLGGKTSDWGHSFDLISDGVSNTASFVGIGFGLRAGILGSWAVPFGIAAGLAVASILWMTMQIEQRAGQRGAELGGAAGFDPDDAILVLPLAMVLGGGVPLLLAAAIGAPAFAAFYAWYFRHQLFR